MNHLKLIPLIALSFLMACANSDKPTTEPPTDWLIDANGVGIIHLGDPISETKNRVSEHFELEDTGTAGFKVKIDGDNSISVSPIDDIIAVIEIYSNQFKTKNGLKVGMTLGEIERQIPDFAPEMNESNGRVSFAPKEFQSSKRKWLMYFRMSEDHLPVCTFEKIPDGDHFAYKRTGEMNKAAVVEMIQIYTL